MPFAVFKRALLMPPLLGLLAAMIWPVPDAAARSREATMVLDANTGRVLHASQADEARFPASLTKMMTLYIVFGEIEAGRMSYATRIKISERAAAAPPSKIDLDPGEEITAINAIKALITKSANDVAVAVAEHIGGSEPAFARLMTERARQIGMMNTTFRNASGLPDPEQLTTARDMITLGLRLHDDFAKHWSLFATRSFPYEGNTYRNHNTMLATYEGVDGIKTGYTRASGFNIVTSVRRGGKHVLVAVFGGSSAAQRNATARSLLNRTLLQASTVKTRRRAPAPPMLVAEARPAPRPARPVQADPGPPPSPPQEVRRARAPAAQAVVRPPVPSPAPAPDAADRAAMTALFAQAAATPVISLPQIDIARVRPVMLAAEPAGRDELSRMAVDQPASLGSVAEERPDRDWRGRAGAFAAPHLPSGAGAGASPEPLGRMPSTLGAQARALASAEPDDSPQFRTTDVSPTAVGFQSSVADLTGTAAAPSAEGAYQLQVGAFGSAGEAERILGFTRSRTGDLLRAYGQAAIEVRKDNRRLYRARFTGFDQTSARDVCTELRRQQIDCFVMRAE